MSLLNGVPNVPTSPTCPLALHALRALRGVRAVRAHVSKYILQIGKVKNGNFVLIRF